MSRQLLFSVTKKDLDIQFFSGSGAGGQHRNKHQNCVRMYHKDSGVRSTGQSSKERKANLREAFKNLTQHGRFRMWQNMKIQEVQKGKTLEKEIDESLCIENLKVEYNREGKWTTQQSLAGQP